MTEKLQECQSLLTETVIKNSVSTAIQSVEKYTNVKDFLTKFVDMTEKEEEVKVNNLSEYQTPVILLV